MHGTVERNRLRGAARTCFGEGRTIIKRAKDNQFHGKKEKKDRDVAFNL